MPRKPGAKRHKPYTSQEAGPFCGAKRRGRPDDTCKQPAGYKTDHPGRGRCKYHGGMTPIKHGRYSTIMHEQVRDKMDQLAKLETNVLDLEPEALLLRALTVEYVNNYEEFSEALLEWYRDPEVKQKPRRIMDISDASSLVEAISRIVERIHKIQSEGAVSLATFARVTEQMGLIVAKHVKDEEVLNAIEAEWGQVAMDAKAPNPRQEEDEDDGEEDEE